MRKSYQQFITALVGILIGLLTGRLLSPPELTAGMEATCDSNSTAPAVQHFQLDNSSIGASRHDPVGILSISDTKPVSTSRPQLAVSPHGVEENLKALIDELHHEELATVLAGMTGMPLNEVLSIPDLREYAARIATIALDGIAYDSRLYGDIKGVLSGIPSEIEFTTEVDYENEPLRTMNTFKDSETKIYSVFDTEEKYDHVLVKWHHVDTPKLLVFRQHPINKKSRLNFVWMSQPEGWESGRYRVEIFSPDGSVKLAAGDYIVRMGKGS